ncbi:hypothetical protein JVU11DRAFT_4023 [Chiua virens]|nr:hypothetical protein JVU11DRAFT_4023 [Chiua virens]
MQHPSLDPAAQEEVNALAAKIVVLQERKQELTKEAFHVQCSILTLQSRIAHIKNETLPISKLPSDVLSIIFEESRCLLNEWPGPRRPLPIEVQLSHVCSRWRQVALSTPSLWTTIRVPILHKEIAVRTYFQRCQQCPLDVHIGPMFSDKRSMDLIASLLIPRISQFRELILDTMDRQELFTLLGLLANVAAPHLRRLTIWSHNVVRSQGAYPHFELFRYGAPLLEDMRLSAIPITFPTFPLKTLHFDPLPGSGLPLSRSDLLSMITPFASTLTTLHLKGFVSGFHEEPGSVPVILPAVRDLLIHGDALAHGFNVFRNISTPGIRSFTLYAVKRPAISSIHKFMTRICPEQFQGLRALHYIEGDMDDDLEIYLPHVTSELTHLSVTIGRHSQLLRLLLNSDKQASLHGTAPLWPNLRTLSLHLVQSWMPGRDDEDADDDDEIPPSMAILLDVIQQRKSVSRPLEVVQFEGESAEAFQEQFGSALVKLDLHVDMRVTVPQHPSDFSPCDPDWAYTGYFYGSQYRSHMYRKMQALDWGLGGPGPGPRGPPTIVDTTP